MSAGFRVDSSALDHLFSTAEQCCLFPPRGYQSFDDIQPMGLDACVMTVVLLLRAQPTNLVQLSCMHCAAAFRLLPWRRLSHLSAGGSQLHLLNSSQVK
jgi:hypothetical protein